jgi:hypothetical protein
MYEGALIKRHLSKKIDNRRKAESTDCFSKNSTMSKLLGAMRLFITLSKIIILSRAQWYGIWHLRLCMGTLSNLKRK